MFNRVLPILIAALLVAGCKDGVQNGAQASGGSRFAPAMTENRLAYIPPQCFTKTQDRKNGPVQNPCYVCHAEADEPNYDSQPELQVAYAIPQVKPGHEVINPWTNLFKDRSAAMKAISDQAVRDYVAQDNYHTADGHIELAERVAHVPHAWDANADGQWNGYVPDAYFDFDADGYDHAPDGTFTGWRAFAYYPFPGEFMPTNGSFDDVLIRLPRAFRENAEGQPDRTVYTVNLAIVEALIKRADIPVPATDEAALGVDLDGDGRLGSATMIKFRKDPTHTMHYVGRAKEELAHGKVHLAAGLFPEGTEFLHSVRYLAVGPDGKVGPAKRMKELRYGYKKFWLTYGDLDVLAKADAKEQTLNPDQAEMFGGDAEHGLSNSKGWSYQGFIEAKDGSLRPQSYEETLFCMGCHSGLSATEDGAFAFPRKLVSGPAHGWYHWAKGSPVPLADPLRKDGKREYTTYLMNNRAGDEFRANTEVLKKFFNADGSAKLTEFGVLAKDIDVLLIPSAARAMTLDKAYWLLVREQSFKYGRAGMLEPAVNVWKEVTQDRPTGVTEALPAPRLALP